MASVQVVLKENVKDLGSIGDVVRVRRGYARNFLLPRGYAVMATRGTMAQVEHEKSVQSARAAKLRAEQQKIVDAFKKVTLAITKEATEEGKLYGSVTAADIVEALKARGHEVTREQVILPGDASMKDVGTFNVTIRFPYDLSAEITVSVKTKA